MKNLLFALLVTCGLIAKAQVYNNEWIDYTKTYYKFKVGKTGLYRIPQSTLSAAGLNAAAQDFQLWRNGVQIPIFTSLASGNFSSNDYIEFWGEMNDGKPDMQLYRDPAYQLNDKWSLETDTASYFLTANTSGSNMRLAITANNLSGNTLPAEPYFMHTTGTYFKNKINSGYAEDVGEYIYSSSYDRGEGWTSNDIANGTSNTTTLSNLFVYATGPDATIKIAVSGNAKNPRDYRVTINNDSIIGGPVDFFALKKDSAAFAVSSLATNTASVVIKNLSTTANDRLVVHKYEITYPRQFNFGGASNFEFNLPAGISGNYLEISGFNFGATAPVLYDITNSKRYVTDISAAPIIKVALQPSGTSRRLVLVSEDAANINTISSLQSRNFINYSSSENQGDYIIISNPLLFNGASGTNPIEDYRAYRSSAAGGGYTAKIYLVDDLVDEFAFGIKKDPLGIRNFLLFAKNRFSTPPKQVFLLGKGVNYVHQRTYESSPDITNLNLVPTFGWPASDVLFTALPGSSAPEVSIGRLSAISAAEVALYLKKVKDYEQVQKVSSPKVEDKAWMKNVVHLVGSNDPTLQSTLDNYMNNYKSIISDTLFGAHVVTFSKTSADELQQLTNSYLQTLFAEGISLITYFGHSSSGALAFNLDNPENYNNPSKYPLFIALGCDAGDFYNFNTIRYQLKETVSEKFTFAQDRGTIGFIASTHFGIINYLDILNSRFYKSLAVTDYGKPVGDLMKAAIKQTFDVTTQEDFYARLTCEEIALNGDPAITVNPHPKPDYVVEDPMVQISPTVISIADNKFKVNASFLNIGKAINQNIVIQITRQYPNQTTQVVYRDTIPGIRYKDSISVELPIDALRDKGTNKLTVTVDADNQVDELYETNNSVTKEFVVYENEARPVYPYNYAIVSKQNTKVLASTANVFAKTSQYTMEMDTTKLFNSSSKVSKSATSAGGLLEFDPGITYKDSTVYYWHIGFITTSGQTNWGTSFSFVYLANHAFGVNQSHKYQHMESTFSNMYVDSVSSRFVFEKKANDILINNGVYPTASTQDPDYYITVNGTSLIGGGCSYNELIFNVFDSSSFLPWQNKYSGGGGLYNSLSATCGSRRQYNFEYSLSNSTGRKRAMDFLDLIPVGNYVVVRGNVNPNFNSNTYAAAWKSDTTLYGSNNSIYHKLYQQGFATLDSFNRPRTFIFIFRKDDKNTFTPKAVLSSGIYDKITLGADIFTVGSAGTVTSPVFGPAKAWKQYSWQGNSVDTANSDDAKVNIIGINQTGTETTLFNGITPGQQSVDISSVNPAQYPYLKLQMSNKDSIYHTPYQLKYWRLTYDPVPEGALAPNIYLNMPDTLGLGQNLDFKIAFKNISDVPFDSVKVKVVLTNSSNVSTTLQVKKYKPLAADDTLHIIQPINSQTLAGVNMLYVEANPDNDQPEQYHFNNFGYKTFYVLSDSLKPLLDVTFDNTHILNHDIVSSKPEIVIKLKDESKFLLLDDTSLMNVQVRYPDGSLKPFRFNTDTLQFLPATSGANDNTATVKFKPYFTEDGDYELIVSGKDKSNNQAGATQYRVAFQIINKAMISNMLNYPNPFTTSTAFVFTITGSEVPQNIKIQVLTVTGKIVREITKEELGPLHIGRNITDFKWDGTDQYGQKLGNGIYLYHVTTNLNGKSLEKYKADADNTDKYFTKGYGKMYLMR